MQVLGALEQIDGIHVGTAGYSSCFGTSLLDMDLLCTSTDGYNHATHIASTCFIDLGVCGLSMGKGYTGMTILCPRTYRKSSLT